MTAEHHNFFFQIWNSFAFLCVVFLRFPWLREIDRELHTFQSNLNGIDSPVKFRKVYSVMNSEELESGVEWMRMPF